MNNRLLYPLATALVLVVAIGTMADDLRGRRLRESDMRALIGGDQPCSTKCQNSCSSQAACGQVNGGACFKGQSAGELCDGGGGGTGGPAWQCVNNGETTSQCGPNGTYDAANNCTPNKICKCTTEGNCISSNNPGQQQGYPNCTTGTCNG